MNEEQLKAIKSLERAFKKCKEANIAFYGMGGELYGISENKEDTSLNEPGKQYTCNDNLHSSLNTNGITINTHKSYRDSGGF